MIWTPLASAKLSDGPCRGSDHAVLNLGIMGECPLCLCWGFPFQGVRVVITRLNIWRRLIESSHPSEETSWHAVRWWNLCENEAERVY